jgi:O-antigen ligase
MNRVKLGAALACAGLLAHALLVPISIAGMQIALAVAAAGLLLDPPRPLRTPLDLPALALVAVAVLSDLVSPNGMPPLEAATLWRSVIGFFIVAHALRLLPQGTALRAVYFACAGVSLASIVAISQYRTGLDVVHLIGLRSTPAVVEAPGLPGRFGAMGFFTSRLTYGHNASVLVACFIGLLGAGAVPRRRIWIVAAAAALGLVGVALTFDRAAYLALCVAALVVAVLAAPLARRPLLVGLAAIALAAAVHPGVRSRFLTTFSVASNADRGFIWSRALEMIREHPIRGVGFANYSKAAAPYYDRVDPSFPMRTWAHNIELSALVEMGPLGLLAMLWLVVAALRALLRRQRAGDALAVGGVAAVVAWLVIGQAHDVLYDSKVTYALWFALGLSLSPRSAQEAPCPSPAASADVSSR